MMWQFLAVHLLLCGWLLYRCRPEAWQHNAQARVQWLLVGTIGVFLPIIGCVIVWLFRKRKAIYSPEVAANTAMVSTAPKDEQDDALHSFDFPEPQAVQAGRGIERLNALGDQAYLDLLMSARELDDKQALALLKEGLGSKTENARLLSYALYSKKEEEIFQQLDALVGRLQDGQLHNPRLHLAIAEWYQHMLDSGVLDPTMQEDAWQKIRTHALLVVKQTNSWQAYALLAHFHIQQGEYKQALTLFKQAQRYGADPAKVLPWLKKLQRRQAKAAAASCYDSALSA